MAMSETTDTPLTDAACKQALKDNPFALCFGPDSERTAAWQFMASRIEQCARSLERQLAEAKRTIQSCYYMADELAEARKDTERLDWVENGAWELYPHGGKYCCAHSMYDAVYAPALRQAIDHAMKGQSDE
jgi:hypothetical protein